MSRFWIKFSAWALAIVLALIVSFIYLNYIGFDGGFTTQTKQGDTAYAAGNYKSALSHYNKAASISDSNAKAKLNVVKTLTALGRQDDAISLLEKFIETNPKSQDIYESLLDLYDSANAPGEKSLKVLKQAASIFGVDYADRAASLAKQLSTVDVPIVDNQGGTYDKPVTVKITNILSGETAYYTLDGKDPDNKAKKYGESGITVPKGKTVLKLIKYNGSGAASSIVSLSYAVGIVSDDAKKALITADFGNNAMNGGLVAASSGYIYYSNTLDGRKLYRCYPYGSGDVVICSDKVSYVNPLNGVTYYINESDSNRIYSILDDGTGRTCLSNNAAAFMLVAGDYIFYSNKSDGSKLYRMNLDGSGSLIVTSDRVTEFNVLSGTVYYKNDTDQESLYSVSYDGADKKKLISERVYSLNIYASSLYYINMSDGGKVYTAALDGSNNRVFSSNSTDEILADSAGLYYIGQADRAVLRLDYDGLKLTTVVAKANASKLNIAFNILYYVDYSNAADMYRIPKS